MVIDSLQILDKSGLDDASVNDLYEFTGSSDVVVVDVLVVFAEDDDEDNAFKSLAFRTFASDWESPEDAVYDSLLSNARPF